MKGCFNISHDSCINDGPGFKQCFNGFQWDNFVHYGARCCYLIYTVCVIHIMQHGNFLLKMYPKSHNFAKLHTICIKTAKMVKEIKLKMDKNVLMQQKGI